MLSKIRNMEKANEFIHGGNANVTIISKKTGNHITYKITKFKKNPDVLLVHYLTKGGKYRYFGSINVVKKYFKYSRRSNVDPKSLPVIAFHWSYPALANKEKFKKIDVCHIGKCCVCGKRLSHPSSLEDGIGPECKKRSYKRGKVW